jgi:hypothetical protein
MKTKVFITFLFLLAGGGVAGADIVELDLFSLGCPTNFDSNSHSWSSEFDLGVQFSEITSVYIDWSGEITAGLAVEVDNPDDPFPIDVGVFSSLGIPFDGHLTDALWGGEETYPAPESFSCLSEFLNGSDPFSYLYDGQSVITIDYTEKIFWFGSDIIYIEHGSVVLNSAKLVVEGTIIPEPSTIVFLGFGILGIKIKTPKN